MPPPPASTLHKTRVLHFLPRDLESWEQEKIATGRQATWEEKKGANNLGIVVVVSAGRRRQGLMSKLSGARNLIKGKFGRFHSFSFCAFPPPSLPPAREGTTEHALAAPGLPKLWWQA